ncbi:MAG: radical SAM protein [Planctomyces sp.]|nr:radical SAM protein [Planctomyces sp.]
MVNSESFPRLTNADIVAARGLRNPVDPWRPYHSLVERECSAYGEVENVATIFLTNRECPWKCLMCDLWKNTTQSTVPLGAIPAQIEFALNELPKASSVKLYNSGNFFDRNAVPEVDRGRIAELIREFRTVIVENHPKLCGPEIGRFQDLIGTQLEVAMGLETSDPATLARLNKQMTIDDFAGACKILRQLGVQIRAFVLLRPPGVSEGDGIQQAIESVRFAFDQGVSCCAVIPTRSGNGILDRLEQSNWFKSPTLSSLEAVMDCTVAWQRGRVFADLWDIERFSEGESNVAERVHRLETMNLTQQWIQPTW